METKSGEFPEGFPIDQNALKHFIEFLPYPFIMAINRGDYIQNVILNNRFKTEIGYSESEIPTIDDWFLRAYPDSEYRTQLKTEWAKATDSASPNLSGEITMNERITTKYHGEQWYEVKMASFKDYYFVTFINTQASHILNEELETISRNKDKMLSILGHDLRGPLRNLHLLSQMAENNALSPKEFSEMAVQLRKQSFEAIELLETSLIWVKSNFEKIEIKNQQVSIPELINNLREIYSESLIRKNLTLVLLTPEPFAVETDKDILSVILRNLLSNAIKFTPENGTIKISTHSKSIVVTDSGVGMKSEDIDRVLNFKNFSTPGTDKEAGLGLGLKLVLDMLRYIRGKISICSNPGQGTSVTISF